MLGILHIKSISTIWSSLKCSKRVNGFSSCIVLRTSCGRSFKFALTRLLTSPVISVPFISKGT
jgi:hypothetical protein